MSDELDAVDIKPGIMIRGKYLVVAKLGSGSFGEVWRVSETVKGMGVPRALKIVEKPKVEVWALKILNESSYTPKLYVEFPLGFDTGIVMSLAAGDIEHLREVKPPGILQPRTSMVITWHLLKALQYMHARDITHRDVKELNVCMKHRPSMQPTPIYLIDYGQAEDVSTERKLNTEDQTLGTSAYCSPLMATGARATKSCDARMMLYAIMRGRNFDVTIDRDGMTSLARRRDLEHHPDAYIDPTDEWLRKIARCIVTTPINMAPAYEEMFEILKTAEEGFDPKTAKLGFSTWNGQKCIL